MIIGQIYDCRKKYMDKSGIKSMNRTKFLPLIFLLILTSSLGENSTEAIYANYTLNSTLSNMPDTRQSTEYSCGAAALQAVLGYWGRDIGEKDLMELLNTDPESGTYPDDIIRVARQMGLEAEYGENLTLADIEDSLQEGKPVMIDCQAWKSVSEFNDSWAVVWNNGHWMVIIGLDNKNVYFEDPYILGSRGFMSRQEFLERWHNPRGLDESDLVEQIHMGIAIYTDKPTSHPGIRHVD
jgi:predicted double-glycine peptidase